MLGVWSPWSLGISPRGGRGGGARGAGSLSSRTHLGEGTGREPTSELASRKFLRSTSPLSRKPWLRRKRLGRRALSVGVEGGSALGLVRARSRRAPRGVALHRVRLAAGHARRVPGSPCRRVSLGKKTPEPSPCLPSSCRGRRDGGQALPIVQPPPPSRPRLGHGFCAPRSADMQARRGRWQQEGLEAARSCAPSPRPRCPPEELGRPRWAGPSPALSPRHVFQELIRATLTEMEAREKRCQPLVCEKSRPVPLKLFTPRLVKV